MNKAKCNEYDYINFLVAAQTVFSATEAARCQPDSVKGAAHDAYTRLLQRLPPDSEALWHEVKTLVKCKQGVLVVDDSTLDKPHASQMALVTKHWSGKHHQVVQGINLISLLWTENAAYRLPCDFRIYNKLVDGIDKNEHLRHMLDAAAERGFEPEIVVFDSWYSGLDNLKRVRKHEWYWLTQFKSNRQVSLYKGQHLAIAAVLIPQHGLLVHLKGYGWIKVFRTLAPNGDAEYWATNKLDMRLEACADYALDAWQIEV